MWGKKKKRLKFTERLALHALCVCVYAYERQGGRGRKKSKEGERWDLDSKLQTENFSVIQT